MILKYLIKLVLSWISNKRILLIILMKNIILHRISPQLKNWHQWNPS